MKQLAILTAALCLLAGLAGCSGGDNGTTKLDTASPDADVVPTTTSPKKMRQAPGDMGSPGGPTGAATGK